HRYVHSGRIEHGGGGADGGQDPAPVRVVAEHRALEQVAPGDRPADVDRVVLGGGVDHLDGDVVLGPLGVAEQLLGQVMADLAQRGGERRVVRGDVTATVAHQQHGVVCGHTAVGVQAVKGDPAGLAQRAVGALRVHHGVGGD